VTPARRAAVTGVGVVAPGGTGSAAFWDLISAGRTATRPLSLFDAAAFRSRVAAECDFHPADHGLGANASGRDRVSQFAVVAAREAMTDSGIDFPSVAPETVSVAMGSAVGCTMKLEEHYVSASAGGRDWLVNPRSAAALYDYFVPSSIARDVAWLAGAEGSVSLTSTGCTAGLDAIGRGAALIEQGRADIVLAGASEAPISPITSACFDAIKATTPNNEDPEHASRPFDRRRDGFVLGEGSAVLVLEDAVAARRRGARVYCEIVGYGARSNAFHMTGLKPDGYELAEAITVALDRARLDPSAIDYVNAHGSGTLQNDRHETAAMKRSLGGHAYRVPVSSIKSMVGHSLGAIGAIEVAACALAIVHRVVPPTANLEEPDPVCDLDYVPGAARELPVDVVLTCGSGFGGFQTALLLAGPGVVDR
jgi:minimal PKS ketosynthase (KS/KS alpha)